MSTQEIRGKTQRFFWPGLIVILLLAAMLRAGLLNSYPLSPDEGIHLIWLRLLAAGYQPYTEVYITYPPLYPLAIEAIWNIWPTEAAQRWFSVAYTLFGAIGVALIGRRLGGSVVGVVAALLTLISPTLVDYSRGVLGEFPSIAWSIWAIWLAWLYRDAARNRQLFLILSALSLSISLLTKVLSPFMVGFIPLIMLSRWFAPPSKPFSIQKFKSFGLDIVIWGVVLVIPLFVLMLEYNIGFLFEQVVDQRMEAYVAYREAQTFWFPRYERVILFLQNDTPLVILAGLGFGLAWLRSRNKGTLRRIDFWLIIAWIILAFGMLAIHNPIRYKHFLILIPPFAILGGIAIAYWLEHIAVMRSRRSYAIPLGGAIVLIGLLGWQIPVVRGQWHFNADLAQPPPDEVEALAFINEITMPDDCLITDDMPLLYWSGRMAPPELAEVSSNRLVSGALTVEELIAISDQYDCPLVAAVSNRIPKYLPAYMDWVKEHYLGMYHYGEDDLFFAKIDTDPQPAIPTEADFDNQILFHGYDVSSVAAPGERVPLQLIWELKTKLDIDYAIFVQLRNEENVTLVSADHQPYQSLLPFSKWPAEAVIQEVVWLELPPDIPAGTYPIYVGLYRPDTGERLPLINDSSGENSVVLGPLVVP